MYRLPTGGALLDPVQVLTRAGLASGMTYADFGCGPLGHFVFPAAAMVGDKGHVYAVDILKGAIAGIESRLKMEPAGNLTPVWGDIERLRGVDIPDRRVDLVSLVNITALVKKSPGVLTEVKRVLKPSGKLLLADWEKSTAAFGPQAAHPSAPEDLEPVAAAAGFKVLTRFKAGPHHWGLVLSR
jgi:ubiquinone/menaquinone biosynthesis C-methylase UbiE